MSLAHVGLPVRSIAESRKFYEKALAPLGFTLIRDKETSVHFGIDDTTAFYVHAQSTPATTIHIAFRADTREEVNAFYAAALAAGGAGIGAPGVRAKYAPDYYAAFVLDPDGNNIEAVHRT